MDNSKPNFFTSDNPRLVSVFGDQVVLAIQSVRLFGKVQLLASTVSLTDLRNRRHFMELSKLESDAP